MIGDPWMTSRNVSQSLSAYFNLLRQSSSHARFYNNKCVLWRPRFELLRLIILVLVLGVSLREEARQPSSAVLTASEPSHRDDA